MTTSFSSASNFFEVPCIFQHLSLWNIIISFTVKSDFLYNIVKA